MTEDCRYCGSEWVVPVLHAKMHEAEWRAGNKFRLFCRECARWLPCTSKDVWKSHDDARVLPKDADPDDPDLVPVEKTDYEHLSENRFECPADGCTAIHTGYPPECGTCGVSYNWNT